MTERPYKDNHCRFREDVYGKDQKPTPSYGSIQWKGTNICCDIHCECGYMGHIDGDFAHFYECIDCGRKYALGTNIKLIELTPEQAKYAEETFGFLKDNSNGE